MNLANKYLEDNKKRFLDELLELLKLKSISTDSNYNQDILKTAEFIKNKLIEAGAENANIYKTKGHPVVYAEKIIDKNLPTVLVYGHYDVQPPDPLELWETPPFDPVVKKTNEHPEGAIFARGSSDDKGQVYMHIKAFEAMNKTNSIPCNIKFIIEGEEEIGSPNLSIFVKDNLKLLAANVLLVSDTSIIDNNTPSINCGLRGILYVEIELTGPNRDLHSGAYGGTVANPAIILGKLINSFFDKENKIAIPGFYDSVINLSQQDRDDLNKQNISVADYTKNLGINDVYGEKGYNILERTSIRPSLDVNGMWSGYTGEGSKTIIPSKAYAKVSLRLVPKQKATEILSLLKQHIDNHIPKGIKYNMKIFGEANPVYTSIDSIPYKAAELAMKKTFGSKPIPTKSGGSVPIVLTFEEELKTDAILLGFGLDSDNLHSPNEKFGLFNFYKGIETIIEFYNQYSKLNASK
ncbi:MAG: dipeptidase [Solitalea-like symbiont of Acarus siro]